jgi:alpha/beta superfamily hydrolase
MGPLEGLLEYDPLIAPRLLALVCHPHPQYGGTLHNKVVFRVAKAAVHLGIPALRFNFRGVGESQGAFAGGIGERDDVRAALDYLQIRFPQAPVCLMGFSFGAEVGLAVGAVDPRVCVLVGLGVPGSTWDWSFLTGVSKPKLIVQGTRDRFGPREQVQALFDVLADPKRIHWVEGADHFFTGRLGEVQTALRAFLMGIQPGDDPGLPEPSQGPLASSPLPTEEK